MSYNALAAAVGFAALIALSGAANATVITDFGNLTPSNNTCSKSTNSADEGYICTNGLAFTNSTSNSTFTASGYAGNPGTSTSEALTLKPLTGSPLAPPSNAAGEEGLGENTAGATKCTDSSAPASNCEIAGTTSVQVIDSNANDPITNAVIGSAQAGENYNIYSGTTLLASGSGTGCTGTQVSGVTQKVGAATGECEIDFAASLDVLSLGVQSGGVGDVLLVSVSQQDTPIKTPEPLSLVMLGSALLGLGLVFRRRRSDVNF